MSRSAPPFAILMSGLRGAWRSLVAHLLWEQGVGGSNPLAPTAKPPRGCSSTVEPQPSKLVMGVRFPSPALTEGGPLQAQEPNRDRAGPGVAQVALGQEAEDRDGLLAVGRK